MKRFFRALATAAAVIAPVMASVPANGATSADVFEIAGAGHIVPGLTATGASQAFDFVGEGLHVGTDGVEADIHCDAYGNDALGTVAIGFGTVNVTCSFDLGSFFLECVFVRVTPVVVVACASAVIAEVKIGLGICAFDPVQLTPPVTDYTLKCAGAYVSVP